MKPLVSVVIPCYNDGPFVQEAIASALEQTYSPKEVIVVDDGSAQDTKNVLKTLEGKHNFHLITQENKGLSAARNTGFKQAKGEYVLTLDADDRFEPSFLEKATEILNKKDKVGFVSCYVNRFEQYPDVVKDFEPTGGNIDDFAFRNRAVACSLYRKECWEKVGGYDEKMIHGYEDWDFHVSITKLGYTCEVVKEYLFNYRKKPTSMLTETNAHYRETNLQYVFKKHEDLYKERYTELVDFLAGIAISNKKQELKRLASKEYTTGHKVLKPLRWLKRLFK